MRVYILRMYSVDYKEMHLALKDTWLGFVRAIDKKVTLSQHGRKGAPPGPSLGNVATLR